MDRTKALVQAIARLSSHIHRPVRIMEVCGTHTVALFRHGIRSLLPSGVSLISGPGCPVCVTSVRDVDIAIELARRPDVILTTFGDMMRVPGGKLSLFGAKAEGADVRVVYSPMDALKLAQGEPSRKVVFFATGFETTSPAVAATLIMARQQDARNFYIHSVHKLVPPALVALLESGATEIGGFLLPGHVCSIAGTYPYSFLASKYHTPAVVTGFSATDILEGILMVLEQVEEGKPDVQIQYASVVREEGNPRAMQAIEDVFEPTDAYWRGIGSIPGSGLRPRGPYLRFDALRCDSPLIDASSIPDIPEPRGCSCGEVLRGIKIPTDCPLFGKRCTPDNPVGACMVSAEGSCAAYYKYGGQAIG